jgi:hypothetical protein
LEDAGCNALLQLDDLELGLLLLPIADQRLVVVVSVQTWCNPLLQLDDLEFGLRRVLADIRLSRLANQRLVVVKGELGCNPLLQLDDLELVLRLLPLDLRSLLHLRTFSARFHEETS